VDRNPRTWLLVATTLDDIVVSSPPRKNIVKSPRAFEIPTVHPSRPERPSSLTHDSPAVSAHPPTCSEYRLTFDGGPLDTRRSQTFTEIRGAALGAHLQDPSVTRRLVYRSPVVRKAALNG
jgi:hypothetical protein